MARSLARNTRMFVSTLGRTALQTLAGPTATNTFEIKVLDGYSFSQDTSTQEIGISEAATEASCGATGLARGTLSFNTALNPVDVSFSTYVRAYDNGTTGDCVERILWASAMGTTTGLNNSPTAGVAPATNATYASNATTMTFGLNTSNANELLPLTLLFVLQNTTYVVENFNVGTAEVDFSIDGIATINWSGNGSFVNEDAVIHALFKEGGTAVVDQDYKAVPNGIELLRNKLSTLELVGNKTDATPLEVDLDVSSSVPYDPDTGILTIADDTAGLTTQLTTSDVSGGRLKYTPTDKWVTIIDVNYSPGANTSTFTIAEADRAIPVSWGTTSNTLQVFGPTQYAGVVYCVPITGGTLTLENNLTYLTPEELAIVNIPLAGFAGSRVTSGSFTAYLNTGAMGTGGLLADMLQKIQTSVTTDYKLIFHMGGDSSATPRVDFTIDHAQISVPSTNVEDIISTEISFVAKPWSTATNQPSFEDTNELTIQYVITP